MADEATAAGLVTEPAPAKDKPTEIVLDREVVDPAAAIDEAAQLDPAKVKRHDPSAKRKSRARSPEAKAAAKSAGKAKAAAAKVKKVAHAEHALAARDEGKAAYDAAKAHQLDGFAEMPAKAKLQLRLAHAGEFIDGALDVSPNDIKPDGGRVTYGKPVEIGPDAPPVTVDEAWLVASSGEAVCCAIGPLSGGGGHHALIPPGHLIF